MAADPIVYCLQELTDYDQFERLCTDLMRLDAYPQIEPLGGSQDRGRDALHVSRATGRTTVFAYSVREDWRPKLEEDATKIRTHRHPCDELAFLTTASVTTHQRDEAVAYVRREFGWQLELYEVERLRSMLNTRHGALLARFPQIFTPGLFPDLVPGLGPEVRDAVVVDYADADRVLAFWLSRRLTLAGYRVWCRGLRLLGGEAEAEAEERAVRNHATRVLALYSRAALANTDAVQRRAVAFTLGRERRTELVIPLLAEALSPDELDRHARAVTAIPFHAGWGDGLRRVFQKLAAVDCPRPVDNGRQLALGSIDTQVGVTPGPEPVLSNCFPAERIPGVVHRFRADRAIDDDEFCEISSRWATRRTDPHTYLSFHQPPAAVTAGLSLRPAGGASWQDLASVDGIHSADLVSELICRAMLVRGVERGMRRSPDGWEVHFPHTLLPNGRLAYQPPVGRRTWLAASGTRTYWRPTGSEQYRYALGASFAVKRDILPGYCVLLRVRVRITDARGESLPPRSANARRRRLSGGWYNEEWLARTLALAQFLAGGGPHISVGAGVEQLQVCAHPARWDVAAGIDETLLPPRARRFAARPAGTAPEDGDGTAATA
jgi:hypothetical protein